MAIIEITGEPVKRYKGLSSDTKPENPPVFSQFMETDTSDLYRFDGDSWVITEVDHGYPYESVQPSQTKQICGSTGAVGDIIHTFTYGVVGASNFVLYDDTTVLFSFTGVAGSNYAGSLILDARAISHWNITTGSATRVKATGRFT